MVVAAGGKRWVPLARRQFVAKTHIINAIYATLASVIFPLYDRILGGRKGARWAGLDDF